VLIGKLSEYLPSGDLIPVWVCLVWRPMWRSSVQGDWNPEGVGASVPQFGCCCRKIYATVLISCLIASPLLFIFYRLVAEDEYRIHIGPAVFLGAG